MVTKDKDSSNKRLAYKCKYLTLKVPRKKMQLKMSSAEAVCCK